jgi:3-oxoacyl-[acyl-carrier-protein] synthase I
MTAFDARLDPELRGWNRLAPLAVRALLEATGKVFGHAAPSASLAVLIALPEPRPGFSAADASLALHAIHAACETLGLCARVELAATGHAGALHGVAKAVELLRAGRCDVAAVGGAESYLEADTLDALAAQKRLAGEGVRSGFYPGEGAGFIVLALASTARRLGISSLATVRGAFSTMEERSIGEGTEVLGHGLAAAIAEAAASLRFPQEAVDAVFCDINGERYRSHEWGMAVLRKPGVFATTAYESPANVWGDMGAAWGALGCVLAVRAWARGYARGPRALVWASSDGGLRGAVVLQEPGRA